MGGYGGVRAPALATEGDTPRDNRIKTPHSVLANDVSDTSFQPSGVRSWGSVRDDELTESQ